MSEGRGILLTMVEKGDGDGLRCVGACACGEGDETEYRARTREALFWIGGGVDGRPGVCARRVDVEWGRTALCYFGELHTCET